jgi:hypothetical protein
LSNTDAPRDNNHKTISPRHILLAVRWVLSFPRFAAIFRAFLAFVHVVLLQRCTLYTSFSPFHVSWLHCRLLSSPDASSSRCHSGVCALAGPYGNSPWHAMPSACSSLSRWHDLFVPFPPLLSPLFLYGKSPCKYFLRASRHLAPSTPRRLRWLLTLLAYNGFGSSRDSVVWGCF